MRDNKCFKEHVACFKASQYLSVRRTNNQTDKHTTAKWSLRLSQLMQAIQNLKHLDLYVGLKTWTQNALRRKKNMVCCLNILFLVKDIFPHYFRAALAGKRDSDFTWSRGIVSVIDIITPICNRTLTCFRVLHLTRKTIVLSKKFKCLKARTSVS